MLKEFKEFKDALNELNKDKNKQSQVQGNTNS